MPANPVEVDVIITPAAPIGVTVADTTIVIDTIVQVGGTSTIDVITQQGLPGVGVPTGGTTGQYLVKTSNADYATQWTTAGGGPPTGAAGGDLAGSTYPNPVVTSLAISTGKLAANAVTRAKTASDLWLAPI